MATLLLGKPVADALKARISEELEALKQEHIFPKLAIVRVGERPDDLSYERSAIKTAASLGIEVATFAFPETVSHACLAQTIEHINADTNIYGCLLFRPLPNTLDETSICNALSPQKDLDGIGLGSLASLFAGTHVGFPPCTAQACVELCKFYGIGLQGKRIAVIGRSLVIGKPAAMLFLDENATVTICHSRSENLASITQDADVVICATGRAKAYDARYFRAGQTVIDVGINVDAEGNLCGDVDFDSVEPLVAAITPVPRGVGSVTTSLLMLHLVQAAKRQASN